VSEHHCDARADEPSVLPPEMRGAVAAALTSRFPIVLWFGADDLFVVCNDGYIPMLGHPYPLVVVPGKSPVFLRDGRRPPVAALQEARREHNTATRELRPGSLVLLYTDGLIERPGKTLDQGFVRLRGGAARPDSPARRLHRPTLRPGHLGSSRSFAPVVPATATHIADARATG
jgi:hypothetical protein